MKRIVFLSFLLLSASALSAQDLIFPLRVDPSKSYNDLITAGYYDQIDPEINSQNFPVQSADTTKNLVVAKLFRFEDPISGPSAVKKIKQAGYRPATMAELLTFGATYPEIQKFLPIVALGTTCPDKKLPADLVPILGSDNNERIIYTDWFETSRDQSYYFLGIKK